jgi:tetratricopeptide (TPR) repeat protein
MSSHTQDNKIGRNDPCSCGSKLKYKKCCMKREEAEPNRRASPDDLRNAEGLYMRGMTAFQSGRYEEAAKLIGQAVLIKSDAPQPHYIQGLAFSKLGRLDEAAACFERALAINPNFAEADQHLAVILRKQGRLDEAAMARFVACCERALTDRPAYAAKAKPGTFDAPLWDGKQLGGKTLLLHCEQGLGDSIQFIRYAALIKKNGGRVVLACPPPLVRLFSGVLGIDQIYPDGRDLPPCDCHAPVMSLPHLFKTTLDAIPGGFPYLHVDQAAHNVWRDRLASCPGLKVGVVWRGNPEHANDRNRSATAALFSQFFTHPEITAVSLQKDATDDELKTLGAIPGVFFDAGPLLKDFADTAACIAALDLVIAVDTSVCHLAGAFGKPVWTLVSFVHDWRWLTEREDTPWYPDMRLFRQPAMGDWQSVAGQVRAALNDLLRAKQEKH